MAQLGRAVFYQDGCPLAWLAVLLGAAWCHGHWGRWL